MNGLARLDGPFMIYKTRLLCQILEEDLFYMDPVLVGVPVIVLLSVCVNFQKSRHYYINLFKML